MRSRVIHLLDHGPGLRHPTVRWLWKDHDIPGRSRYGDQVFASFRITELPNCRTAEQPNAFLE